MTSPTWRGYPEPSLPQPSGAGWLRLLARGVPAVALIVTGLALMLLLRVIERPVFGERRPWTPWITVFVCRGVLACFGLGYQRRGTPMRSAGAMVANHQSWMDIFVLNAAVPVVFVSKADVRNWPGIGILARVTGTIFVARDGAHAKSQVHILQDRLAAGHCLVMFPEGTSTDGAQVLPFKSTLFAPLLRASTGQTYSVQPVSVVYRAPRSADPRLYGWWGDMGFGAHLLHLLAAPKHGLVDVVYHPILTGQDRKALAKDSHSNVASGHTELLQIEDSALHSAQ